MMDAWVEPEYEENKIIDFDSYKPEIKYYTACGENQTLTQETHISDDIYRTFEDRDVMGWKIKTIPPSMANPNHVIRVYLAPVTKKHIIIHYGETDYKIQ